MVAPALERALCRDGEGVRVPLIDTSCGTGALLQFADPARHELAGTDVHGPSVTALSDAARGAGFQCHFSTVGMEQIDPTGFGVALINPPFSLHLEAPTLVAGPATHYGRFGPDTSALSHAYAVQQALAAADVVGCGPPPVLRRHLTCRPRDLAAAGGHVPRPRLVLPRPGGRGAGVRAVLRQGPTGAWCQGPRRDPGRRADPGAGPGPVVPHHAPPEPPAARDRDRRRGTDHHPPGHGQPQGPARPLGAQADPGLCLRPDRGQGPQRDPG